jgi:hypothetical protein
VPGTPVPTSPAAGYTAPAAGKTTLATASTAKAGNLSATATGSLPTTNAASKSSLTIGSLGAAVFFAVLAL